MESPSPVLNLVLQHPLPLDINSFYGLQPFFQKLIFFCASFQCNFSFSTKLPRSGTIKGFARLVSVFGSRNISPGVWITWRGSQRYGYEPIGQDGDTYVFWVSRGNVKPGRHGKSSLVFLIGVDSTCGFEAPSFCFLLVKMASIFIIRETSSQVFACFSYSS